MVSPDQPPSWCSRPKRYPASSRGRAAGGLQHPVPPPYTRDARGEDGRRRHHECARIHRRGCRLPHRLIPTPHLRHAPGVFAPGMSDEGGSGTWGTACAHRQGADQKAKPSPMASCKEVAEPIKSHRGGDDRSAPSAFASGEFLFRLRGAADASVQVGERCEPHRATGCLRNDRC